MSENIFDILVDFVKIRHEKLVSDLLSVVCEDYSPYKNFIEKIKEKFIPRESYNIQVYNYIDKLEEELTNLDLSKLYNNFINLCYKNNGENKEYLLLLIFLNSLSKYSDNSCSLIQNIYKSIIQYASKKLNIYFIDFNISKNCKLLQLYTQGGVMSDLSLVQILFVIHLVSFYYYNIKFEDKKNDKYNDLLNYDINNDYKLLMVFMFIKDNERINNYLFWDIYNRNHNIFNSFILSICLSLDGNYLIQNIDDINDFLKSQINPQKGFDENIIEQIDKHLNTLNNFINSDYKNWIIDILNEIMSNNGSTDGENDDGNSDPPDDPSNGGNDDGSPDGQLSNGPEEEILEEFPEEPKEDKVEEETLGEPEEQSKLSSVVVPTTNLSTIIETDVGEIISVVLPKNNIICTICNVINSDDNKINQILANNYNNFVKTGITTIPEDNTKTYGERVISYIKSISLGKQDHWRYLLTKNESAINILDLRNYTSNNIVELIDDIIQDSL